jgi:hypothetical protein
LETFNETFIATLDGDDYWLDPRKLDKQAHKLISHPDSNLSHHTFKVVEDDIFQHEWPPRRWRSTQQGSALAEENFIGSSTVMFRREALPRSIPQEFNELLIADYPMWSLISENSKVSFIDEVMSAYRIHDLNSWNKRSFFQKSFDVLQAKLLIASMVSEENEHWWREAITGDVASIISRYRDDKRLS